MLMFSGFHVDRSYGPPTTSSKPIASMETRRRIVCQVFIADKFLAAFVGRPALLTRRFCSIHLPLDLGDDALLSDRDTFQRHLLRVDSNGWDMDGRLHPASVLRVRTMVALIRDEILEIGLGCIEDHSVDDIMYEKLACLTANSYRRLLIMFTVH